MKLILVIMVLIFTCGCAKSTPQKPPRPIEDARLDHTQIERSSHNHPKLIYSGRASFPSVAAAKRQEGWCIASYDVTSEGQPTNIQILDCSPQDLFEKACLDIVKSMRYESKDIATQGFTHRCVYKFSE